MAAANLFIKSYSTEELAQAEFDRTLEVYNKLAGAKPTHLGIARPIEVKNSNVYFEKITDCANLRSLICRLNVDTQILYYVGQALAQLHLALNPESNILEEHIDIHGDFWASNVLYNPEKHFVYFVDLAPSRYMDRSSYSHGSAYLDLAQMVYSLEVKYPLYKIHLLARRKNRKMTEKFLKGYETESDTVIDLCKLLDYIIKDIDVGREIFRQKNFLSRLTWSILFNQAEKKYRKWQDDL